MTCHVCGRTFTTPAEFHRHRCTTQLDLFGQIEAAAQAARDQDRHRIRGGLHALRDDIPDAMHVLVHLQPWRAREDRSIGLSGLDDGSPRTAYSIRNAGLYYEDGATWGGWGSRPANLVTWDELRALLADDPRRAALTAWYDAVPQLQEWVGSDGRREYRGSWRDHTRPYELDRSPRAWDPAYIEADHAAPGWPARLTAWTTLQAILTDTAGRI